jgi:hypothetical protein
VARLSILNSTHNTYRTYRTYDGNTNHALFALEKEGKARKRRGTVKKKPFNQSKSGNGRTEQLNFEERAIDRIMIDRAGTNNDDK